MYAYGQKRIGLDFSARSVYTDGRYAIDSKVQLDLGWRHWRSFCLRMNRPLFLRLSNPTDCAAAASHAKLFLHYETALHDVKARSVAQKIWAVGVKHKNQFQGIKVTLLQEIKLSRMHWLKMGLTMI